MKSRQHGAALLLFTLVLLVAFSSLLVGKLNQANARLDHDNRLLNQAHEALRAYAAMNKSLGKLPCPDLNGDGKEEPGCGSQYDSRQGWLPTQTLNIGHLRDSSGSCLWYVVNGRHKRSYKKKVESSTRAGMSVFNYDGAFDHGDAVALVISPGSPINAQVRPATSDRRCPKLKNNTLNKQASKWLEKRHKINNANGKRDKAKNGKAGHKALPTPKKLAYIQARGGDRTTNDLIRSLRKPELEAILALKKK